MAKADELRERLTDHLALVRAASQENEFVDQARAEDLHAKLHRALDAFDDLDPGHQEALVQAVDYLVRVEDEEDDLRSPIGFDDDGEVVEAALAAVRPSPGGTDSGSATK